MAGTDPQKQLLTLIRDFASEKSQGERRVVNLKKRIEELQSELDEAHADLQEVKRFKETSEQELKGYEVELALTDASIQALEARISMLQDEISSVGSEVEGLKNKERASRDEFIGQMFELNNRIRKFQEGIAACEFQKENSTGIAAGDGLYKTIPPVIEPVDTQTDYKVVKKVVTEVDSRTVEDMLAHVVSQINKEEQEYLAEENIQKQVQKEYVDFQRKVSLMEVITKETKALQDLASSELEHTCTSLGEELQKRCVCPSCHIDNMQALGGILQAN